MAAIPVEALESAQWNEALGVNLTGAFLVARAALPLLRASGSAARPSPWCTRPPALQRGYGPATAPYGAAKAGLIALTKSIAAENAPLVRAMKASVDEMVRGPLEPILDRAAAQFEIPGIRDKVGLIRTVRGDIDLWLSEGPENLMRNVPALWRSACRAWASVTTPRPALWSRCRPRTSTSASGSWSCYWDLPYAARRRCCG